MEITFKDISKQYKNKYALKNFTTTLHEGVYGLLGENGAGKTTLINIFVGILCSDSGTIQVDGQDVRAQGKDFLSQIGYMPQYPIFYRDFTVKDFLLYMCTLKDIPTNEAEGRVLELLATVNLLDGQNKKIGALSGGMRQRVGIAQAMLSDPKILILDEPTAGLDPSERIRFRNLISRFAQGRTILLATHIVSDVECIAREILLLKQGRLLMQGTPAALEHNMEGKVWNITAKAEEAAWLTDMYCVSNMKQESESFLLRVVGDGCPTEGAQPTQPNLEDVFLYYCREEDYDTSDTI
ncbi:MAG: ABC transporter ATP-binding protein [Firmicutes bacterium]|nr:ABC transporter ATP-binding protein [Bacillota bacterium]